MKQNEVSYYGCVFKPNVVKTITTDSWLTEIKTGKEYGGVIHHARTAGKGSDEYDNIKKGKLPCITWNFLFDKYKKDENIIKSTGFIYFDIDDSNFNPEILDKSKIYSFFKSLSNAGVSIIVKTTGVTYPNFTNTYRCIANEIGISSFVDPYTVKPGQFTVLSHDPDIYINDDSFVFNANDYPILDTREKVSSTSNTTKKKGEKGVYVVNDTFSKPTKFKIRLTDATDYLKTDSEFEVFDKKINVTQLYFPQPKSLMAGKRNMVLSTMLSAMLNVNHDVPQSNAYKWLCGLNYSFCAVPLAEKEVISIFKSNWKNWKSYAAPLNKKRKIVFKADSKLSKTEKLVIVGREMGKQKRKDRTSSIIKGIEDHYIDEKITAQSIARNLNAGIATIKRYWPEVKGYASEMNQIGQILLTEKQYQEQNNIVVYDELALNEIELKIYQDWANSYFISNVNS